MGNNQSEQNSSIHYLQATHLRIPTTSISLPASVTQAGNHSLNLLRHPQFPNPETYFLFSNEHISEKYSNTNIVTLFQVKLQDQEFVVEKQISTAKYSGYDSGHITNGFIRSIPNGFEAISAKFAKSVARFQLYFDGTVNIISSKINETRESEVCFVKDTYYWVGDKNCLVAWNVETDSVTRVQHDLGSIHYLFTLNDNTILCTGFSYEALEFDIPSQKFSPFPLFAKEIQHLVHLNETTVAYFVGGNIRLMNTKTRQTRIFNTGFECISNVHLLPRASNDAPFEFIGTGSKRAFKAVLPASFVCELGFGVAKDATIQTANGSVAVHKLILAARIPKSLDNGELLNWSFASKSAAEKVVQFLYSGWIDVGAADADLKHISLIAQYTNLQVLTRFLQTLASGTDAKLNEALQEIAKTRKKPKDCKVDGVPYEPLFDAYWEVVTEGKNKALLARRAAENFPNSLLVERFVKSVEGCSLVNLHHTMGNLERDLATLVFNPVLSDIAIVLSGKKYPAHSIFFKESELVNTMKELNNDEEKLVIDLDKLGLVNTEEELKQLLVFAYTGTLSLPNSLSVSSMIGLARLGFFFGFKELQNAAETWFAHHVEESNAKELLDFACKYNCERIISACQQYLSPTPNFATNLVLNMSDIASIKDVFEQNVTLAKHFRVENNNFKFENGELDILAPIVNHSSMTVLNYELPYETGFKVSFSFSEPEKEAEKQTVQIMLCDVLPTVKQFPPSFLQFSCIGLTELEPRHAATKGNPSKVHIAPLKDTNGISLSVDIVCVPMKFVDPSMDNHLLIATFNGVSHSFHVKFSPEKKYYIAVQARNGYSIPCKMKLKSFNVEFNSNAEKEWVPAIMDMPLTCFRSCCNQMFTLKTNNDMACNAHISYANKEDPYNCSDYDFADTEKVWGCCMKEHASTGCYVAKHGLAKTFQ